MMFRLTVLSAQQLRAAVQHRPVKQLLQGQRHGHGAGARVAGADDLHGPRLVGGDGRHSAHFAVMQ